MLLNPPNGKHSAVIRIEHQTDLGSCTAFIINDEVAITAKHCLKEPVSANKLPSFDDILKSKADQNHFAVYNSKGENTFVVAQFSSDYAHADVAFLRGDFRAFNKAPLHFTTFDTKKEETIWACGYAGGFDPPVCTNGTFKGTMMFMGATDAYVAKGMSGGPVLNKDGKVIGVNSYRHEDGLSYFGILFGLIKLRKK
jgi:V8-like Glu-specific endopeptidase